MKFGGKKVLVVGLGSLGGGVSIVKWLLKQGADVTVTDLKSEDELRNSIELLGEEKSRVNFVLGKHRISDFTSHEIIVVNPAVKLGNNRFIRAAREKNVPILNDLVIFLDKIENRLIAVTGTRGKTTTANWITHFLSGKFKKIKAGGNSPEYPLLKMLPEIKGEEIPAVVELSSFQLEIADLAKKGPDIAIITNFYRDHLNRHGTMKEYLRAKANIFKNQNKNQKLILNYDNEWTKKFISLKPKSKTYFISLKGLPKDVKGLYISGNLIIFRENPLAGGEKEVFNKETLNLLKKKGGHNMENFLFASLASFLAGISWENIRKKIESLPQIKFREEKVMNTKNVVAVNDSAATSPEASIAAIERFGREQTVLIAGGTDKNLEYKSWAKKVNENIKPKNLFLLEGSATDKMIKALDNIGYFKNSKAETYDSLENILRKISKCKKNKIILFSPGAASFEKFKNEFDRGDKFNLHLEEFFNNLK